MKDKIEEAAKQYADYENCDTNLEQCFADRKYNGFIIGAKWALSQQSPIICIEVTDEQIEKMVLKHHGFDSKNLLFKDIDFGEKTGRVKNMISDKKLITEVVIPHLRQSNTQSEAQINTEDKWISVEDRLPENTGWYQVYTNDEFILTAKVAINGWWTIPFGSFYGDMGPKIVRNSKEIEREVTHWMPLPSPPLSK